MFATMWYLVPTRRVVTTGHPLAREVLPDFSFRNRPNGHDETHPARIATEPPRAVSNFFKELRQVAGPEPVTFGADAGRQTSMSPPARLHPWLRFELYSGQSLGPL